MQTFLQLVAHDLYSKIGNDLSRTVLVFPNKRANLFFNEYLAGESDQPIWAPAAMSISDLFQKLSVQKSGDPIRSIIYMRMKIYLRYFMSLKITSKTEAYFCWIVLIRIFGI